VPGRAHSELFRQNRAVGIGPRIRVLGVTATVLALADVAYQAVGEARDRRAYPPPGRLVDVGGHRLHIRQEGHGTPPVVIIPALGGLVAEWLAVQDALASFTTAAVYDRPGLGWSDPTPGWPTVAGMAGELHDLLDAAGIARPLVLAGHSLGGLVARVYTRLYPDEIAGLALIDASHPRQFERLPAKPGPQSRRIRAAAEVALDYATPLALRRLRRSLSQETPRDAQAAIELFSRNRRAVAKELLAFDAICCDTGVIAGELGDLPLAVVTSSEHVPGLPEDSPAQRRRGTFYPAWLALQEELAALSASSIHVVSANSGHLVHKDDPDLVVKTVTDLVRRVRRP
jgi:pimeloyl-ACP methyl ester carboxylesterase